MPPIRPASLDLRTFVAVSDGYSLETTLSYPHSGNKESSGQAALIIDQPQPSSDAGTAATTLSERKKLAVLTHPWSWLGGRMDDQVLHSVSNTLLGQGYHVIRFNSRSVGRSTGRASFTGLPESRDFQDVVRWGMNQVGNVGTVALVGYSHGCLPVLLHPLHPQPVETAHILISFPLSPLPFLTAFHSSTYTSALSALTSNPQARVLILYGDRDQFTAVGKYDSWVNGLTMEGKSVECVRVAEGDHFWRGQAGEEMRNTVKSWLDRH